MKVKYPDDYIRETRSIIAAAELTYVYKDPETGEFVVAAGEDIYVLQELDSALNLAAGHILDNGPVDEVEFIPRGDGVWDPDIYQLRRDLDASKSRRKK